MVTRRSPPILVILMAPAGAAAVPRTDSMFSTRPRNTASTDCLHASWQAGPSPNAHVQAFAWLKLPMVRADIRRRRIADIIVRLSLPMFGCTPGTNVVYILALRESQLTLNRHYTSYVGISKSPERDGKQECPDSLTIRAKQAQVAQDVRAMPPMCLRASDHPAHARDRGSIYPAARHNH